MTQISYRHDGLSPFKITVKVDGKVAGAILRTPGGASYYYKPRGGDGGVAFPSVELVKRSLESDEDCVRLGDGTYCFTDDELLDALERTAPGSRPIFAEAFAHYRKAGLQLGEIFDRVQSLAGAVAA